MFLFVIANQYILPGGGEDPPLDMVVGVETSPDVGGEQGRGPGLPGPAAAAGGIGQGRDAGIPDLPPATADPAMTAELQNSCWRETKRSRLGRHACKKHQCSPTTAEVTATAATTATAETPATWACRPTPGGRSRRTHACPVGQREPWEVSRCQHRKMRTGRLRSPPASKLPQSRWPTYFFYR